MPLTRIPRLAALLLPMLAMPVWAQTPALVPTDIIEWKAVYGQVESRDLVPARARLGGELIELAVVEGDAVTAGQAIARIVDQKLGFQLSAIAAQRGALVAQLDNAKTELKRGQDLLKQGVATAQGLDALRTQVDVLTGQLLALDAQAEVIGQQQKEGVVLAPVAGRVLDVPLAKGGVVMPGETIATIGGGGSFLRVSVPERHAGSLHEGDKIEILAAGQTLNGRLSRIYPLIQNGRVTADVEIAGLPNTFEGARVLVRLPIGHRMALMVPETAIVTKAGLDFVALDQADGTVLRTIIPGPHQVVNGVAMVEVISGLVAGDHVLAQVPSHE